MGPAFDGSIMEDAAQTTLTVCGEADLAARADFDRLVDQALATKSPTIVVDVADLRYLESACLRALIHAYEAADGQGRRFVVRNASGIVRRVLDVAAVSEILLEDAEN
jgi:anti-anti-sigma factor